MKKRKKLKQNKKDKKNYKIQRYKDWLYNYKNNKKRKDNIK